VAQCSWIGGLMSVEQKQCSIDHHKRSKPAQPRW
jgi:hypothetical protein